MQFVGNSGILGLQSWCYRSTHKNNLWWFHCTLVGHRTRTGAQSGVLHMAPIGLYIEKGGLSPGMPLMGNKVWHSHGTPGCLAPQPLWSQPKREWLPFIFMGGGGRRLKTARGSASRTSTHSFMVSGLAFTDEFGAGEVTFHAETHCSTSATTVASRHYKAPPLWGSLQYMLFFPHNDVMFLTVLQGTDQAIDPTISSLNIQFFSVVKFNLNIQSHWTGLWGYVCWYLSCLA